MNIVAFGGRIGAGKSTISRAVAERLGVPRVSFGDVVRDEARRRNLPATREALQNLGDAMIAAGWDAFCERVVATAAPKEHDTLIVDGVRHIGALEGLAKLAVRTFTVFIDAPWDNRLSWRNITAEELRTADAHPNEAEVDRVRSLANVIVVNDAGIEEAVAQVIAALSVSSARPTGSADDGRHRPPTPGS